MKLKDLRNLLKKTFERKCMAKAKKKIVKAKKADKYTEEQRKTFVVQPEDAVAQDSPAFETTATTTKNL